MNLDEIEVMNFLQEWTLEELDNVLGAGSGIISFLFRQNNGNSESPIDIVNYVDSIIFVDKSSRDVIKDTHDNLIYRNQNYRKLFGLKEEVHND